MKWKIFLALLLLLSPCVSSAGNVTVIPKQNSSENTTQQNVTPQVDFMTFAGMNTTVFSNSQNNNSVNNSGDRFDDYDAGSDMVAEGTWIKGPTLAGDKIYEQFGMTRGSINEFITYNVNPDNIPIAKDYNNMNTTTAVILAVLFVIGEGLATSVAAANYPAYRNVFGDKDFSQERYAGGGISMIAGLGASWIFRGIMTLINLVDAYMMILVMDAIKPSLDTGIMYFAMAIIELILFAFFFYRQIVIVSMYIVAPIYGVFWASGYLKEFIDSIGDKVIRALIMQPLCIFVTTISILVMQVMELDVMGVTIWEADDKLSLYFILLIILLYTCGWCLFGKMTLVKRTGSLVLKKAVYAL